MKNFLMVGLALLTLSFTTACSVVESPTEVEIEPQLAMTSALWNAIHNDLIAGVVDTEAAQASIFNVDLWWVEEYEFGPGITGQYAIDLHRGTNIENLDTDMTVLRNIAGGNQSESQFEARVKLFLEPVTASIPHLNLLLFTIKMADGYDFGPNPWIHSTAATVDMRNAHFNIAQANVRIWQAYQAALNSDWLGVAEALRDGSIGTVGAGTYLNRARLDVIRALIHVEQEQGEQNSDNPALVLANLQTHLLDMASAYGHLSDAMYHYEDGHLPPPPTCDVNCGGGNQMSVKQAIVPTINLGN